MVQFGDRFDTALCLVRDIKKENIESEITRISISRIQKEGLKKKLWTRKNLIDLND